MSVDSTRKEQLHMIRVPPDCPRLSIGPRLNVRQFVVLGACDEARVIERNLGDSVPGKAGDLQGHAADERLYLRWREICRTVSAVRSVCRRSHIRTTPSLSPQANVSERTSPAGTGHT